jgi:hypothetical protein
MSSDVERTSITVSKETAELLRNLKFDLRVDSNEEAILILIKEHKEKQEAV